MTTAEPRAALTLTARSVEDLLAAVPVVLGFTPTDSLVMLTFGGARTFHARLDLPPPGDPHGLRDVVGALLAPARTHGVRRVVVVVYSDDEVRCRQVAGALGRGFRAAGIDVLDVLRVDGRRWYPALGRRAGVPAWGVPFDVAAHPFTATAVLDGRVSLPSREALAATLAAVPGATSALGRVLETLPPLDDHADAQRSEGEWVVDLVAGHTAGEPAHDRVTVPSLEQLARLVRALRVRELRDAAWWATSGADPRVVQSFWTEVLRHTPAPDRAPVATLLGFAAWTGGHGALAWCAVEVAEQADPDYSLMALVRRLLAQAVPPRAWEPRWHWRDLWDGGGGLHDEVGHGALGSGHGRTG